MKLAKIFLRVAQLCESHSTQSSGLPSLLSQGPDLYHLSKLSLDVPITFVILLCFTGMFPQYISCNFSSIWSSVFQKDQLTQLILEVVCDISD